MKLFHNNEQAGVLSAVCSCRQYYFIGSLQTGDGGAYRCGVQTSCGTAFSTNAVSINSRFNTHDCMYILTSYVA